MATTFERNPHLVTTQVGEDELVLLHLETNNYYSLNETGQFIWKELLRGRTREEITTAILQRWEAEASDVHAYVTDLIAELQAEELLVPSDR